MRSPCVQICHYDVDAGLCRGCGRRMAEIQAWPGMTDAERERVMAQLPERLKAHSRKGS